ncbi:MAG: hypothetical protein KF773_02210 [Deltaproteobacteria bacterium]|nr:hypothetical protein [Deltaproteobacteria bacterium]
MPPHRVALVSVAMVLGAFVLGLVLISQGGDKKCRCTVRIGLPSGETLPRRGSLYLRGSREEWKGAGTLTEVADGTWRIDFDLADGEMLEYVRLRATDAWRAPAEPPRLVKLERRRSRLWATVDQAAAAYRARWTYGGVTTEGIEVPRNHGDVGLVRLWWIPASELDDGGRLELIAIRFDGSEIAVADVPDEVGDGISRRLEALLVACALALVLAPRACDGLLRGRCD